MKTNVTGAYYISLAFLPLLSKGGANTPGYSSQIVNMTSTTAATKGTSNGRPVYAASKAAAMHLSRMLATTFKDVKVRVNVIAPGIFPSEMTVDGSDEDNNTLDQAMATPAGRPGKDSDMAATILFLAGKGGLFYNGQILYPEGGTMIVQPAVGN
ncbi:hypothetical protein PQX77_012872 [Marasmius sp. AFHP31]|nr:hypothetical protein PQX77_012872 [Marasmius sp. AFHP31]